MLPYTCFHNVLFFKVLSIDPKNGVAKSHLGFILKSELKYKDAIPLLLDGVRSGEAGSGDARFYFHLGDAYTRIGQTEQVHV